MLVNVIPPAMSLTGMVMTRPSHQARPEAHRKPTEIWSWKVGADAIGEIHEQCEPFKRLTAISSVYLQQWPRDRSTRASSHTCSAEQVEVRIKRRAADGHDSPVCPLSFMWYAGCGHGQRRQYKDA